MDYDAQGFVDAADGTRLFYGVKGPERATNGSPAPAMIFNDGIGCDGFAWRYLLPHFAETHRCIHWHYRGHGRSGPPIDRARLDVPTLARDLMQVMDHLGVPHAVQVGHSMGTQVCLELYRIAPERVDALVLLCGSYGKVTDTFHGTNVLSRVLPSIIESAQAHRGVARALWSHVPSGLALRLAKLSGEVDAVSIQPEDFEHYWNHVKHMDPDVFLPMLRLAGEHTAEDLLASIAVPTLVLPAERDTFTPAQLALHMAQSIPNAEHMVIRGGSHAAPVEQPVAIQLRIEKFLQDRLA